MAEPGCDVGRLNFATMLGAGGLLLAAPIDVQHARLEPGKPRPLDAPDLRDELNAILHVKTRRVVAAAPVALRAGLILGSPEWMYR